MYLQSFDYDIKDEISALRDCQKDTLYKFLLYKVNAQKWNFDCDRCDYTKSIYSKLWGFDDTLSGSYQNISVGRKQIKMGMETMNSFWTTFAWALNKWCIKDIKKEIGIVEVCSDSQEILLKNYDKLIVIMEKNLSKEIVDKFIMFAQLTHTIGNMILVPKKVSPYTDGEQNSTQKKVDLSFNMARASKWNDYFDLSLLWLYNNREEDWTKETFICYAEKFFLMDYVTEKGKVIPLIKSHGKILRGDFEEESRPKSKKELAELLDNINNRIVFRGKLMHAKINNDESILDAILENRNINSCLAVNIAVSRYDVIKNRKLQYTAKRPCRVEDIRNAKKIFIQSLGVNILLSILLSPLIVAASVAVCGVFGMGMTFLGFILAPIFAVWVVYYFAKRRKRIYLKAKTAIKWTKSQQIRRIDYSKGRMIAVLLVEGIIFLIIYFTGGLDNLKISSLDDLLELYVVVFAFMIPWLYWFIKYALKTRCRQCKCCYTIKCVRRKIISKQGIMVNREEEVLTEGIDFETGQVRDVITYQEQLVPGERVTYMETYKCKWCNAPYVARFSIDY